MNQSYNHNHASHDVEKQHDTTQHHQQRWWSQPWRSMHNNFTCSRKQALDHTRAMKRRIIKIEDASHVPFQHAAYYIVHAPAPGFYLYRHHKTPRHRWQHSQLRAIPNVQETARDDPELSKEGYIRNNIHPFFTPGYSIRVLPTSNHKG
ncbi:hypothetical protein N657DRAFT_463252 [Parathielavia appendiculata]|uniref:Uncharacterized protein n=1 Tax=Parathielavia appendiculata TaxID=2587402 RepID=A0AAN6U160_9PEZI|nr:hypothetical protein N657DRAFT_463252 [Parathielavia appendiculata]